MSPTPWSAAIASGQFAFIIVNFANPDMVGHTGDFAAAVRRRGGRSLCLGELVDATLAAGGSLLVTADHGNAEMMIDQRTGGPMTAHTTNPVPVWLVTPEGDPRRHASLRAGGRLSAIAPTVLVLLGLPIAPAMTEPPLIAPA